MKKLSQINEGMFKASIQRSNSKEVRKEDVIKYVDLGGSVLWMEEDISIGNKELFKFDEIESYKLGDWRRPTQSEADELFSNDPKYEYIEKTGEVKITHKNGNSIFLKCKDFVHYWEYNSENTSNEFGNTFSIQHDGNFFPHSAYTISKKNQPQRLRLVKDKK